MLSKQTKIVIGIALLSIGGTVGFYQHKLNVSRKNEMVTVVKVAKDITKGQVITGKDVVISTVDKNSTIDNAYTSLADVVNKIANENMLKKEQINNTKVIDSKKYQKEDIQLISVTPSDNNDSLVANEVKPGDVVDLYFEKRANSEGGEETIVEPIIRNVVVTDVKNADGISYKNKLEGEKFISKSVTFWLNAESRAKVIEKQQDGYTPRLTIHSNRSIQGKQDK